MAPSEERGCRCRLHKGDLGQRWEKEETCWLGVGRAGAGANARAAKCWAMGGGAIRAHLLPGGGEAGGR